MPPTSVTPRFVIESLVRKDGTVSLAEAYEVAGMLGLEDQPLRLAARRLISEGAFTQEGRGRAGTLHRTRQAEVAEQHDVTFLGLAYAQDEGRLPWDGAWRLLAVTLPETQRALRDRLRRTLRRLGAGQLQPGLHLSPHAWQHWVLAEIPELARIPGVVFGESRALTVGGVSDPQQIAAGLWDLETLAASHDELRSQAEVAPPQGRSARLARALELAHTFDRVHAGDPLLPPELLPADWAGAQARAAFRSAWTDLTRDLSESLFERYAGPGTPNDGDADLLQHPPEVGG